jgi:hypothetical protein
MARRRWQPTSRLRSWRRPPCPPERERTRALLLDLRRFASSCCVVRFWSSSHDKGWRRATKRQPTEPARLSDMTTVESDLQGVSPRSHPGGSPIRVPLAPSRNACKTLACALHSEKRRRPWSVVKSWSTAQGAAAPTPGVVAIIRMRGLLPGGSTKAPPFCSPQPSAPSARSRRIGAQTRTHASETRGASRQPALVRRGGREPRSGDQRS